MKIHMRDTRLFNNAGISYPICYFNLKQGLDLDKSRLALTGKIEEITCKHCKRIMAKRIQTIRPK